MLAKTVYAVGLGKVYGLNNYTQYSLLSLVEIKDDFSNKYRNKIYWEYKPIFINGGIP
jgi:hypothetical protein